MFTRPANLSPTGQIRLDFRVITEEMALTFATATGGPTSSEQLQGKLFQSLAVETKKLFCYTTIVLLGHNNIIELSIYTKINKNGECEGRLTHSQSESVSLHIHFSDWESLSNNEINK